MDLSEVQPGVGGRHPWESARAKAVERVIRRHVGSRPRALLDFGCGDGFTGSHVQAALDVPLLVGVDVHLPPDQCGRRLVGGREVVLGRDDTTVAKESMDLALLCDVIEHVEDDEGLVRHVLSKLVPDGYLMITVPAFQSLFSEHDRFLRHYRRYRLSALREVIRKSGASTVADGYLFGGLLPARALGKGLDLIRGERREREQGIGGWRHGRLVTRAIELALDVDNACLLGVREMGLVVPGLSAWALCKKPS